MGPIVLLMLPGYVNGAQLGWLLDRQDQQVEIYRPGRSVEVQEAPAILSGESVLPGFVLHLQWV
ncbi:MAG: hypothetical protein OHK0047_04490 [Leptolyngbyaceae cyanobacterium]